MKDNDIKKMFDNAIESNSDTNINSEKIQNTVMERLGKQARDNLILSDTEEAVEPIFVTPAPKNSGRNFRIAAFATAACLGIAALSMAAIKGNIRLSAFSESGSDDVSISDTENTDVSDNALIPETTEYDTDTPEEVENAETIPEDTVSTASEEKVNVNLPEENPPVVDCTPIMSNYEWSDHIMENPDVVFCILDGTLVQVNEELNSYIGSTDYHYPISYRDGRLYYTANGENKDISDIISMDDYYLTTYINSVTGLTHYVFVGGDLEERDFGYCDLFKLREDDKNWNYHIVWYDRYFEYIGTNVSAEVIDEATRSKWAELTQNRISEKLSEAYPNDIYMIHGGGGACEFRD